MAFQPSLKTSSSLSLLRGRRRRVFCPTWSLPPAGGAWLPPKKSGETPGSWRHEPCREVFTAGGWKGVGGTGTAPTGAQIGCVGSGVNLS